MKRLTNKLFPGTNIRHLASGIFGLLFILMFAASAHTQQVNEPVIDPHDPDFRAQFSDIRFEGNLALKVASDQTNNYYILDFTQVSTRFEKVWFVNQVFQEEKVVLADTDITQEHIWFLSSSIYNEQEVMELFSALKQSTDEVSLKMTAEEKEEWLKTNDKYK